VIKLDIIDALLKKF